MGVYTDHGIEYHVVCKDGKRFIVASTHDTDTRLLESKFYKVREGTWTSDDMYRRGSYMNKIVAKNFDIELTQHEWASLEKVIGQYHDVILEHGWYEVNSVSTTL